MKNKNKNMKFICLKKITDIINSCETIDQLKSCKNVIDNYVYLMYKRGIDNPTKIFDRLMKEYNQKRFQIKMLEMYIGSESWMPITKNTIKFEKSFENIF